MQQHTDGALARFYTVNEWREQVGGLFNVEDIRIMGQKPELLPLPASAVKNKLLDLVPTAAGRMILNHFGQGSFLVSTLRK